MEREQQLQVFLDLMIEAVCRAYSYIVGVEQLKMFVSKTCEAMFMIAEEKGYGSVSGSNLQDVAKSIAAMLSQIDPREKDWTTTSNGDKLGLTISKCQYAHMCSEMFSEIISSGRVDKTKCPCIMAEFIAGGARNIGIKARTTMQSFAPGHKCVSEVIKMEM